MTTTQTIDEKANGAGTAGAAATRRTVATYRDYATAERAVDWLSDQGFAVESTAIVGKGLRYEIQVDEGVADEAQRLLGAMPGGR